MSDEYNEQESKIKEQKTETVRLWQTRVTKGKKELDDMAKRQGWERLLDDIGS